MLLLMAPAAYLYSIKSGFCILLITLTVTFSLVGGKIVPPFATKTEASLNSPTLGKVANFPSVKLTTTLEVLRSKVPLTCSNRPDLVPSKVLLIVIFSLTSSFTTAPLKLVTPKPRSNIGFFKWILLLGLVKVTPSVGLKEP